MDIQQDSTDTRTWMCRVPHGCAGTLWELDPGETGPRGSGIPGEQDPWESRISRTMRHMWEQGPGE